MELTLTITPLNLPPGRMSSSISPTLVYHVRVEEWNQDTIITELSTLTLLLESGNMFHNLVHEPKRRKKQPRRMRKRGKANTGPAARRR